jgi:hypothetical protein
MLKTCFFLSLCVFLSLIISQTSAEMHSWVDENGVRHFSNSGGPADNANTQIMEEYKPDPAAIDTGVTRKESRRSEIMRRYKENVAREKAKMDKILEKEKQEYDKKVEKRKKMLDDIARERQKSCQEMKRKLVALQRSGWRNFTSSRAQQTACPDRQWVQNGRVYNNNGECISRRNRYQKAEYEQAVRAKEYQYKMFCR